MKFNRLSAEEIRIIENKGTELPFRWEIPITSIKMAYIYVRGVPNPLFYSKDRFNSNSGGQV